jgi:hypothetical protein
VTPLEVLMHLRAAWQQDPQRALSLTVCPACRDALLDDLDRAFVPTLAHHSPRLEDSQVMGFTFSEGTPAQCALHSLMHEEVARAD